MKFRILLFTLLALAGISYAATVEPGFSVGSTNHGLNTSWAIVSANSPNQGQPWVTALSWFSATNGAVVTGYRVLATVRATGSFGGITNFVTGTTPLTASGWATNGGILVIRHISDDSYEKRVGGYAFASTNLVMTQAPMQTVAAGDIIYAVTTTYAPQLMVHGSMGTNTITGNPLMTGNQDKPFLVEINGFGASSILNVSGYYR
jgi:hypothetical protein